MAPIPKARPKLLEKREAARARETRWRLVRKLVLARHNGKCRVCWNHRAFDAHHLLARSLGGKDELGNLIPVCRRCHEDIHGHVVILRWRSESDRAGTLKIERVA